MEKFVYYTQLFDCYKGLLNSHERDIFSAYYEENLSLQEIAEQREVSRSAIGSTIKNVEMKLASYERVLHLEAKAVKLKKTLLKIEDENLRKEIEKIWK